MRDRNKIIDCFLDNKLPQFQPVIAYLVEHFHNDAESLYEFITMHNGDIHEVYNAIKDHLPANSDEINKSQNKDDADPELLITKNVIEKEIASQEEKIIYQPAFFSSSEKSGESDEFPNRLSDFFSVEEDLLKIQNKHVVKLATPDTFKEKLQYLLESYQRAYFAESDENVNSSFLGSGRIYNLGRGIVNTVRPITGTSSALMLHLKKYIENNDPQNREEIVGLLSNRKIYVENTLLQTNADKYCQEINLLNQALSDGLELMDNQKQAIGIKGGLK